MKEAYYDIDHFNFKPATVKLIRQMDAIVTEYVGLGYRLTVRQLYYQLVARGIIENTERSYARVKSTCNDGRLAGMIDWDAIEDRTRAFRQLGRWDSGADILRSAANSFHKDMWEGQQHRVFIVVEKDALANVISRAANPLDVPYLAARGYPSATVLREFVQRDLIGCDQDIIILHCGDHDPSGIDMTRDLEDRISLFLNMNVSLERIALNMDQVRELKPPPNPAKVTDSRFDDYMRKYGHESWELDALPPDYLARLIRETINQYIDQDKWSERKEEIERVRTKIETFAKRFKD